MLHILVAIGRGPSLLLIDEMENSLHNEILSYIISEIKDSGITAIVATHSPVVVDKAWMESLLLTDRGPEGLIVRRPENIEEAKRGMGEKGLRRARCDFTEG